MKKIVVKQQDSGQRIDNFLIKTIKGVPKSLFYRLLRKGAIKLNGKKAKPEHKLLDGDELSLPEIRSSDKKNVFIPEEMLNILENGVIYEDDNTLVLNKPAGLAVHGGSKVSFGVIDILRAGDKEQYFELGHRLDKETSGCLLVAKNKESLLRIHDQFASRKVDKSYIALVRGLWPKKITTISKPIDGYDAITKIKILETHGDTTLLLVKPITGRMHQIRIHLADHGYPILGDKKYGPKDKKFKKLFLHCESLCINIFKSMKFFAPINTNQEFFNLLIESGYKYGK